ncbi:MAG: hydroxymethylpyrimidine/phosphomethylpyrimidine kinase, partial [Halothiobacillaceae bacterium]|nr:hydroxymethylpyrimidine/phosphomethylpyrimidine kinase [Halothiobacillaceae bacterium]
MSESDDNLPDIPVVMVFAGHDPTGGAGIGADIESIISQGCHPVTVVTALTVQDTRNVIGLAEVDPALIVQQARAVLEDMPVSAFKIGLVGSIGAVEVIHSVLRDYPDIPVVLDPVLAAGGGTELADAALIEAINTLLVPLATVVTPNSVEARRMVPEADSLNGCGLGLLEMGCDFV